MGLYQVKQDDVLQGAVFLSQRESGRPEHGK